MINIVYPFAVETAVIQYRFVKMGTVVGQVVPAGDGENAIGVAHTTAAAGENVNVCIFGECLITAGAAIALNTVIRGIAAGKADDVATTIGEYNLGIALEVASADDDIIKMLFGVGNNGVFSALS